jgi:O-antigen/teichoic acid export membrane protein
MCAAMRCGSFGKSIFSSTSLPLLKNLIEFSVLNNARLLGKFAGVQIIIQFIGFGTGLLLIRLLCKEEYALYTLAVTMLGTMSVLADSGMVSGALTLAGKAWDDKIKLSHIIHTGLLLQRLFSSIVLLCLSPVLFLWLESHGAKTFEAVLATILVAMTLYIQTGNAILGIIPRILLQTNHLQTIEVLTSLIRFTGVVLICFLFVNLTTALLAGVIATIFQWFLLTHFTKKDFVQNCGVDSGIKAGIMKVVARQAPNSIFFCIQSQVVMWLLGIFGNPAMIADAGALGRLTAVFTVAGNTLTSLVMPRFSRCHSASLLWIRFHQILGLLVFILAVLILSAIFFPKQMLWILGKQYKDLEIELVLMIVAQSLNCLLAAVISLNMSRGWVLSPWISISTGILSYFFLFHWIGATSLKQFLLVGILATFVALVVNYLESFISLSEMKMKQEDH